MYKFYDTSSLLIKGDSLFDEPAEIVISSITLAELEEIKNSATRDSDLKFTARKLLRLLDKNPNKYEVYIFNQDDLNLLEPGFLVNNDARILASFLAFEHKHPDEVIFVTDDLCLKNIANTYVGTDSIISIGEDVADDYFGYKEVVLTNEAMADFYSRQNENMFNLLINEYLLIYNEDDEVIDKLCWTGTEYRHLNYIKFNSQWFGEISPYKGDCYQQLAADSLVQNKITMLRGPAGTGKTLLSLGCLMSCLEHNKIDKIIIFCNTVATKGSAKLGYYPGSKDEKLLDSQIGNLLSSKLGGREGVERLMDQGQLVLLPLSDIRGYDTSGMKAGIYISEAQNLDVALMKLALQRIGDDCFCIVDGDFNQQVDDNAFAGMNNGMRRASQVFRNNDIYGEVKLKQIHRSRIAAIAEQM